VSTLDVPTAWRTPVVDTFQTNGGWFERYAADRGMTVPGWTYVPICWTVVGREKFSIMMDWLTYRMKDDVRYFTIVMDGRGLDMFKPDNLTVVGPSSGDITIPLVSHQLMDFDPVLPPKKRLVNFIGTVNKHTDYKRVRRRSIAYLPKGSYVRKNNHLPFDEYFKVLQESRYTLAPRGFGPTSFRMYEALAAASVPIYVWEDELMLPFRDRVDWSEIAIVAKHKFKGEFEPRNLNRCIEFFREYCKPEELLCRIIEELKCS